MARFSENQWNKIHTLLEQDGARFGLPERRDKSVVISSFNIRMLTNGTDRKPNGKSGRTPGSWKLLSHYASRCDLLAIQEVGGDLGGINRLKKDVAEPDKCGLVVSDVTGAIPGTDTSYERLAFLFRWDRVQRTELASDITYDKRAILDTIYSKRTTFTDDLKAFVKAKDDYADAMVDYQNELEKFQNNLIPKKPKKPSPPKFFLRDFVAFMRTPHCVSFKVPGRFGAKPYEFLAVNAHLLFGDKTKQKEERRKEFYALTDWLIFRTKQFRTMYYPDFVLFGDMNLEFEDAERAQINERMKALNEQIKNKYWTNFPMLSQHPAPEKFGGRKNQLYRSTARMTQTYDQIGFFSREKGDPPALPHFDLNDTLDPNDPDGYNYGVFNFMDLFATALHGKRFDQITAAQRKTLISRIEFDVSDHMPIWVRLPIPGV